MSRKSLCLVLLLALFTLLSLPGALLADACDEWAYAADPVFSVAIRHASDSNLMTIKIANSLAGVRAIVVGVSGEEESYDQLLVVAERAAADDESAAAIRALTARDRLSFSTEELPVGLSHLFEAPRDGSARLSVRLYFADGSERTFQLCEAGAQARLTVRLRLTTTGADNGDADISSRCYCVRLECTGSTYCNIEKECCGFPMAPCACCSCGPGGNCAIVCPPCDQMP